MTGLIFGLPEPVTDEIGSSADATAWPSGLRRLVFAVLGGAGSPPPGPTRCLRQELGGKDGEGFARFSFPAGFSPTNRDRPADVPGGVHAHGDLKNLGPLSTIKCD